MSLESKPHGARVLLEESQDMDMDMDMEGLLASLYSTECSKGAGSSAAAVSKRAGPPELLVPSNPAESVLKPQPQATILIGAGEQFKL